MTQEITPARSAELAPLQLPAAADTPAAAPTELGACVQLANANAARAALAGRALLAHSCAVGAAVERAYQIAAKHRLNIKPLFADHAKAGGKAARCAGGAAFTFTYAHGNNCRKLYLGICERMIRAGGYTPETLERALAEHVGDLLRGGQGNNEALCALFAPYLQADTMRQQLLLLFPKEPPAVGAPITPQGETALPAWEDLHAEKLLQFDGYLSQLDAYLQTCIKYTRPEERAEQADRLEAAARHLRNMQALPGIEFDRL